MEKADCPEIDIVELYEMLKSVQLQRGSRALKALIIDTLKSKLGFTELRAGSWYDTWGRWSDTGGSIYPEPLSTGSPQFITKVALSNDERRILEELEGK
jgi:hypothetical protein